MKKRLLSVTLAAVMVVYLTGCGNIETENESKNDKSMFVCVADGDGYDVVYCRETKVMYVIAKYGSGSGTFTLLVNADGTPMLYESED